MDVANNVDLGANTAFSATSSDVINSNNEFLNPLAYGEWLKLNGYEDDKRYYTSSGEGWFNNLFTGEAGKLEAEYQKYLDDWKRNYDLQMLNNSRAWDEYQRSTAYQRTVEDLKKAGLNPYSAVQSNLGIAASPGVASGKTSAASYNRGPASGAAAFGAIGMIAASALKVLGLALTKGRSAGADVGKAAAKTVVNNFYR